MLALGFVGELTVVGVLLAIIGVGLIALSLFIPEELGLRRAVAGLFRRPAAPLAVATAAPAESETTGPVIHVARRITWPTLIDPTIGELTPAERRRLLEGFGIVADAWSATVLAKAFDEEEDELRVVAIESLAQCDGPLVEPTLERAYASYAVPERYAAIDGASRRGDVALLERALRDTDGTVALAAAYGLQRAKRTDVIDNALHDRTDIRANEIRRVLPMLG
jgi:hypothetical protein